MTQIERRRCRHCTGLLSTVQLDGMDFVEQAPAVVCDRCDGGPAEDEPLVLPSDWE